MGRHTRAEDNVATDDPVVIVKARIANDSFRPEGKHFRLMNEAPTRRPVVARQGVHFRDDGADLGDFDESDVIDLRDGGSGGADKDKASSNLPKGSLPSQAHLILERALQGKSSVPVVEAKNFVHDVPSFPQLTGLQLHKALKAKQQAPQASIDRLLGEAGTLALFDSAMRRATTRDTPVALDEIDALEYVAADGNDEASDTWKFGRSKRVLLFETALMASVAAVTLWLAIGSPNLGNDTGDTEVAVQRVDEPAASRGSERTIEGLAVLVSSPMPQMTTPSPPTTTAPKPTTTVAPKPTTTVAPKATTSTKADPRRWMDLIRKYPWDAEHAYRIMMCESGGNPNAINRSSGATGLFQIHPGGSQYLDPVKNADTAYAKYKARGWAPWVCKA